MSLSITPPELVHAIAQFVPDLDAFTRSSWRLRAIALPVMFRHLEVSSPMTLESVSRAEDAVVSLIR